MSTALNELLGIEHSLIQAPMVGSTDSTLAIEVAKSGGLGSIPCAMLDPDTIRSEVETFRRQVIAPVNLNFFCHAAPNADPDRLAAWNARLDGYFIELGLERLPSGLPRQGAGRASFGADACRTVEELRPEVVSFHFGLPATDLVDRVRATRATIVSSATSVEEARWLEDHGCDVIIAQGAEAGGHRGMFLHSEIASQVGTIALLPQVVDAVGVPVVAAGGITDARGIAAALVLGAQGVQLGTAFLLCQEAITNPLHRAALAASGTRASVLTNVFTGRPARSLINRVVAEVGPMAANLPDFPLPAGAMAPLRAGAESVGSSDFSPLWAGQSAPLARTMPAQDLIRELLDGVQRLLATPRSL